MKQSERVVLEVLSMRAYRIYFIDLRRSYVMAAEPLARTYGAFPIYLDAWREEERLRLA